MLGNKIFKQDMYLVQKGNSCYIGRRIRRKFVKITLQFVEQAFLLAQNWTI